MGIAAPSAKYRKQNKRQERNMSVEIVVVLFFLLLKTLFLFVGSAMQRADVGFDSNFGSA